MLVLNVDKRLLFQIWVRVFNWFSKILWKRRPFSPNYSNAYFTSSFCSTCPLTEDATIIEQSWMGVFARKTDEGCYCTARANVLPFSLNAGIHRLSRYLFSLCRLQKCKYRARIVCHLSTHQHICLHLPKCRCQNNHEKVTKNMEVSHSQTHFQHSPKVPQFPDIKLETGFSFYHTH